MKTFENILSEASIMLKTHGKISFRALKRNFAIDDDYLDDLIYELCEIKNIALVEKDIMLVYNPESKTANYPDKDKSIDNNKTVLNEKKPIAERRQLTVMFIDLVGSTPLSRQLDPEDFANILYEYQEIFDSIVKKYGGVVVQLLGDGIMSYFGHPIAHEDDPIRAILSGMEMLTALKKYNTKLKEEKNLEVQVRIGVHTGLVVIGKTQVLGHTKMLALGEAPNLAARIQGSAKTDTLYISAVTNRLVKGIFNTVSTGFHNLRGVDEPLELFQVIGEKTDFHNDMLKDGENSRFVGRELEKSIFNNKWEKSKGGSGQVLLVHGIAGIGKSRLSRYILHNIASTGYRLYNFYCSPYNQNTSYYAIIRRLNKLLDLNNDESSEIKIHKVKAFLKKHELDHPSDLALLINLLNIKNNKIKPLSFSSEITRNLTSNLILRWLINVDEPVIMLFEDVHWADPTTLELLDLIINKIKRRPIFCVITYRPEFVLRWKIEPHITDLEILRLATDEAKSMILQIAKNIPANILQNLIDKTDGNPLFVEEVTKYVLESGLLNKSSSDLDFGLSMTNISIPSTLQDSLMARIDQLGQEVKYVVQMGSTLGRQFTYNLIYKISKLNHKELKTHLNTLVNAEMLYKTGVYPDEFYTFKHALTQETAYESLLIKDRQEIHKRIIKVLETSENQVNVTPELIAHHCTEAGLTERAITYWKAAGEKAISHSAHKEAINHLRKGLQLLQKLPDSPKKIHDEIFFYLSLGVPYTVLLGYGSKEVEEAYAKALELCGKAEDSNKIVTALYGLWRHYLLRGEYQEATSISNRLLDLNKDSDDIMYKNIAYRSAGSTAFYMGNLDKAKYYLEKIVSSDVSYQKHEESLIYDVIDLWVAANSYLSWTYWLLGDTKKSLSCSTQACDLAYKLNHPFSIAFSLCFACWLHQFRGEYENTIITGQKGYQIAEEHGFKFWHGWANLMRHWVGDYYGEKNQLEKIEYDIQDWYSTGSRLGTTYFLYLRAERYLAHGLLKKTKEYLDDAIQFINKTKESFWKSEIYRLTGEYFLKINDKKQAENYFRKAYKTAKDMNANSLSLRAAISLAELNSNEYKFVLTDTEMQDLIDSFTEDEDNIDVSKAKDIFLKRKSMVKNKN